MPVLTPTCLSCRNELSSVCSFPSFPSPFLLHIPWGIFFPPPYSFMPFDCSFSSLHAYAHIASMYNWPAEVQLFNRRQTVKNLPLFKIVLIPLSHIDLFCLLFEGRHLGYSNRICENHQWQVFHFQENSLFFFSFIYLHIYVCMYDVLPSPCSKNHYL